MDVPVKGFYVSYELSRFSELKYAEPKARNFGPRCRKTEYRITRCMEQR